MKPTGSDHVVTTQHDLPWARTVIAFRNDVLWPTRKLQRVLIAVCVVAVGFMVAPGALRWGLWAAALLVLVWVFIGDAVGARALLAADPLAKARKAETLRFGAKGFASDADGAGGTRSYADIRSLHADERCWVLGLGSGEALVLARGEVDGGAMSDASFESFLTSRNGPTMEPLRRSLAAKVQRAQEGRRGYLESHPSKLGQLLGQRGGRGASGR